MKELFVNGRKLICDGQEISVDELYTQDFYAYTIGKVELLDNDTYAVNEVYDSIGQDYFALQYYLKQNNVERIVLKEANSNVKCYLSDIAKNNNINTIGGTSALSRIMSYISFEVLRLSSAFCLSYLMFKIPYTHETIEGDCDFTIVRTEPVLKKIMRFEFHKEIEYPINKKSIYRLFPQIKRQGWVFRAYINSFAIMKKIRSIYKPLFGKYSMKALNEYYSKRIVYAEHYKLMLDNYMSYFEGKNFYTTDNIDRFSVIQDQVAPKHGIKTYNIPHGIEYGFKFPKGFSSDVFYANTQYTADYLNKLYDTDKYVFDESITNKLFVLEGVKPHKRHIVFFTEPRDAEVNIHILEQLIPLLKKKGLELKLKLHPLDSKERYDRFDAEQLSDYGEAMVGNVCIARKSTCLLEAVYNNSTPIAIITNPKDKTKFELFPSLNSEKIIKAYSVEELYNHIIQHI